MIDGNFFGCILCCSVCFSFVCFFAEDILKRRYERIYKREVALFRVASLLSLPAGIVDEEAVKSKIKHSADDLLIRSSYEETFAKIFDETYIELNAATRDVTANAVYATMKDWNRKGNLLPIKETIKYEKNAFYHNFYRRAN